MSDTAETEIRVMFYAIASALRSGRVSADQARTAWSIIHDLRDARSRGVPLGVHTIESAVTLLTELDQESRGMA